MQKSPEDLSVTFYLQYSFLQRESQNIMSKITKQKAIFNYCSGNML